MSKNINVSTEIMLLDDAFYKMLIDQLNKDFNLCGIQWENHLDIIPENLFLEADKIIQYTLQKEGDTFIYALLYRIDINEKVIRQTNFTCTSEITTLVLRREMEKIWLRIQYSK
jgi:hypothetical protein